MQFPAVNLVLEANLGHFYWNTLYINVSFDVYTDWSYLQFIPERVWPTLAPASYIGLTSQWGPPPPPRSDLSPPPKYSTLDAGCFCWYEWAYSVQNSLYFNANVSVVLWSGSFVSLCSLGKLDEHFLSAGEFGVGLRLQVL
jgi:hypothetical protein